MNTRIDEIADGIYRISTLIPDIAPPAGFSFNQFLVMAEEPLIFHCGMRALFPAVSAAVASVTPIDKLRWISFGHVEADECGAMNAWLATAPNAQVVHGMTACQVSLNDLADRPPRALADGEALDLGGKRVRWIDTPHVPHAWEAGLMFEEITGTLFCGDLFTHAGDGPPLSREDVTQAATATEEAFHSVSLGPATGPTIRDLKRFSPTRLATMHGSTFEGDCAGALDALADYFEAAHRRASAA